MNLTIDDLKKGISWWRKEKADKWPQDFHNTVYYQLYNLRKDGLTEKWWYDTVDRLWAWRAIRSKTPPNTKEEIYERGLEVLDEIQKYYVDILTKTKHEPVFLDFTWNQISDLYYQLSWIKNSSSPIFPSKMEHFIFPKLFGVMDHEATGKRDYAESWSSMSKVWNNFGEKEEAKTILAHNILEYYKIPVHEQYPFEIKIIELCGIGREHTKTK